MADDPGSLQPLIARVGHLASIDAAAVAPLMEELERVIVEDNRKGVLSGTDKDGNPLAPVTYRKGAAKATRTRAIGKGFGAAARTIRDLFDLPGGREWWEDRNRGLGMTFEMRPGSRSWQAWKAYVADKRRKRR